MVASCVSMCGAGFACGFKHISPWKDLEMLGLTKVDMFLAAFFSESSFLWSNDGQNRSLFGCFQRLGCQGSSVQLAGPASPAGFFICCLCSCSLRRR